MNVVENIAIPESLFKQITELTEKEGISLQQFVSSAVAEKAAAWLTVEYLRERAERASKTNFLRALGKVPNEEPDEWDKLEE
ncbi:MAG: toxin-antitoxin system HicB family antitoxin [Pyrinomonadaceae bacterium]|nr:toxin-antitoxin system HicB family antitoxin [Pyrinomonadaceae bacterium]